MAEPSTDSDPMEPILHRLDPDGDVMLILRDYDVTSFAVWDEEVEAQLPSFTPGKSRPEWCPPAEKIGNGESSSLANNGDAADAQADDPPEVRMLVSSCHLILASTYFKSMLHGNFSEGIKFHSSSANSPSYHQIITTEWDPSAMLILMNIVHGRTRNVPRSVDLQMLTKIAVLVDYYDCAEVVEVFSDMWVEKLRDSVPKAYCRELAMWMWVAFAFRKGDVFREVTTVAMMESRGAMQMMGLPMPESVIRAIEGRRLQSITEVLDLLYGFKDGFGIPRGRCCFECKSLFIGCLALGMSNRCLCPRPEAPFLGLSFTKFEMCVREIESLKWPYCKGGNRREKCAGPDGLIHPTLDKVRSKMAGLKLEKFKGPSGGDLSDKRALDS
ncbi:hypothetical protein FQN53_009625 [Emmonsiellopsis sp. PD_33]|nr:hypothetical protein FQN53_009625 [Emmonsiellopsis sp. PD_33]